MSIVKLLNNTYTAEALNQWEVNQVLQVYGLSLARVPEVHFSNHAMSRAIPVQATMDAAGVITVSIPNSLLQKPYTITAHVCGYNGTTFETYCKLEIPVKSRPKPADYTLENDDEVYSFNALENAVANAQKALNDATATLKETSANMDAKVDVSVKNALPGFLDDTLTSKDKAAQAAAVRAAIAAAVAENAETHLQIVTGSYVGTGETDNFCCSLTFPIQPKMILIGHVDIYAIHDWTAFVQVFISENKVVGGFSPYLNYESDKSLYFKVSDDGLTVSWEAANNADGHALDARFHLNTAGTTYHYFALC